MTFDIYSAASVKAIILDNV